ncbi:MAG: hypothetical protein J6S51_04235 [Kiritimatiellae bacterium]|nr:hypothetical protein [Kiritimatiellia bacterium]
MKKILVATVTALTCAFSTFAADEAKDAPEKPVVEKKVKRPKKKLEYNSVQEVREVAKLWECPVVALITLAGSKNSNKLKNSYFSRPELKKELFLPNAVFCSFNVPSRVQKPRRNDPIREVKILPMLEEMRQDYQVLLGMALDGKTHSLKESHFPIVAVLTPVGKLLGFISLDPGGTTPLEELVNQFSSLLKSGKYPVEITPKMQKIIDKDKKVKEREAKRAARMR